MTAVALRLPLVVAVLLLALHLPAPVARAGEAEIAYGPAGDPSGLSVLADGGIGACAAGCISAHLAPGRAVRAGEHAALRFAIPAGTLVVGGEAVLRLRTRHAGVVVRLQQRFGRRWLDGPRLRSAAGTVLTVPLPKGGEEIGVVLRAEVAVPQRAVRAAADNRVAVDRLAIRVRDLQPPVASWQDDPSSGAAWLRGDVCGTAVGEDRGLGVARLEFAIGDVVAGVEAPPGPRLQPRPTHHAARLCVDTRGLADGTYGTSLVAVEHGDGSTLSAPVRGVVRVDNAAPAVVLAPLEDAEERRPELRFRVEERASGVASLAVEVDGEPAAVADRGAGAWVAVPPRPLGDGPHRVAWQVEDLAGNVAGGQQVIAVADATPPVVDGIAPIGPAASDAIIRATVVDRAAGVSPDAIRLAVDGVDLTALLDLEGADVVLRPTRPWSAGEHRVRIVAVDRSGNRTVREWSFAVPEPTSPSGPIEPPDAPEEAGAPDAAAPLVLEPLSATPVRRAPFVLRVAAHRGGVPAAGLRLRIRWRGGPLVGEPVVDAEGVAELRIRSLRGAELLVEGAGQSVTIAVRPDAGIRLRAARTRVRAGDRVRLSGRVRGDEREVRIEARSDGRWVLVARVPADAAGRFATPVRIAVPGRYAVRARAGDDVSSVLHLRAR